MSTPTINEWCCRACKVIVPEGTMLRAPNPWNKSMVLLGCPNCRSVDQWDLVLPVCYHYTRE
jgi:hypothetical protein